MRVFITGITGTLGTALAMHHAERGDEVSGCSNNREKSAAWLATYKDTATLYYCGASELYYERTAVGALLESFGRVYHCAATKYVDVCEANPSLAAMNNVEVTDKVAAACRDAKVELVYPSSCLACMPRCVYGATKLLAERIVLQSGGSVVRLGNLVGSSGSVFLKWREAAGRGEELAVTDPKMTRYFVGVDEAARFAADEHVPGRVVAPHMKSAEMGQVAASIGKFRVTGPRPGETRHQRLVAPREPVEELPEKLVLGGDFTAHDGWCSRTAERWDTDELLRLAGIEI